MITLLILLSFCNLANTYKKFKKLWKIIIVLLWQEELEVDFGH